MEAIPQAHERGPEETPHLWLVVDHDHRRPLGGLALDPDEDARTAGRIAPLM
jgi:hypothetical protein